jgi:hypothetical protein
MAASSIPSILPDFALLSKTGLKLVYCEICQLYFLGLLLGLVVDSNPNSPAVFIIQS